MRIPNHPAAIRRLLQSRLTQLNGKQPVLAATLAKVSRRCGNQACPCASGGPRHTAHQLTYKEQGKTRTVYVPVDLVEDVRAWVAQHKRIKRLLAEIHLLSVALVKGHAKQTTSNDPPG